MSRMEHIDPASRLVAPHSAAAAKVGQRVADLRRRAGLSRAALAECADLDVRHLQRIERGHANPTLLSLVQVAVALEVPLADLVAGIAPSDVPPGRRPYGYSAHDPRSRRRFPRGPGS